MVVFTCSYCGDSVKKNAVVKHYETKCRNKDPSLTCVDCLKDFRGNEHQAHTKCVTEEERYSAKGAVLKTKNKGEKKQQAWQECIDIVLKKQLKPDERELIEAVSKHENGPRKKSKFVNLLSNCLKKYAKQTELIDRVWSIMESGFREVSRNERAEEGENQKSNKESKKEKKPKENSQPESNKQPSKDVNGTKKEKKRKRAAEEDEQAVESVETAKTAKKKKQKSNEENKVEGNGIDMLIDEDTESKQKKHDRKRKASEEVQIDQTDSVADEAEPRKKKKQKKNDKPAETKVEKNNEETKSSPDAPSGETQSKKRKNKKPKGENAEGAAPVGGGDGVAPAAKEKKSKKSENKENVENSPAEKTKEGEGNSNSKKKKSQGKDESGKQENFDWKVTILKVLNQDGENNRMPLQNLQKKVLRLYCKALKCESSEKHEKSFMKKLKHMPQVEIDNDFVVLKS